MANELRLFSEAFDKSDVLKGALIATSRSKEDAENREKTYRKVFSNFQDLSEITKTFSGVSEIPLLSNQYFNATVASYVTSFAGIMSIERDMDQPTALLWYLDLLGVTDNRKVLPNTGVEDLTNLSSKIGYSTTLTTGNNSYSVVLGKKVIPGSVTILVKDVSTGTTYTITDDKLGNLMAISGVLTAGTINYVSGNTSLTLGSAFTVDTADTLVLSAFEDAPGTPDTGGTSFYKNRFKVANNNISMATIPDMLIGESNLLAMAAMKKAINVNPTDILGNKLTELYTKLINTNLVNAVKDNYIASDSVTIDVTTATTGFNDYRSKLDEFTGGLVDVESALAKKSVKGVRATAYIVGQKVKDIFKKTKQIGMFRDNTDSTYVNDLIGYYDGVPVLHHSSLADTEGYAIHKTADGNLAPVMRGIFLPLTNTPAVGNYDNPTQMAQGVYYQEGVKSVAMELAQKFTVTQ